MTRIILEVKGFTTFLRGFYCASIEGFWSREMAGFHMSQDHVGEERVIDIYLKPFGCIGLFMINLCLTKMSNHLAIQ